MSNFDFGIRIVCTIVGAIAILMGLAGAVNLAYFYLIFSVR